MFVDLEYLDEATKVTMTFGRMNPISIGHEKLANKVISVAKSKSSEPRIYLSHTQNSKKDPLNYKQKIKYAKGAFGDIVKTSTDRNIVQLLKSLQKEGVKEVILVVGSDRVTNFRAFLKKYNGKDFTFDKITVVSAGQRDPDDSGVAGMSGTKLRSLAAKGDEATFSSGLSSKLSTGQKSKMFKDVRDGMNISEQEEKKNGKNSDLKNEPFLKISDDELEKMIDDEDDEELEPDEGDVEVAKYIFPDDEEEIENEDEDEDEDDDEEVNEIFNLVYENDIDEKVLNFQQRQKIAMRMRRLAPKMARLRKIRAKRMATPAKLVYRARKAAMVLLRKRAAGKRGENYKSLSRGEKMSIDRTLQSRYKPAVLKKMIDGFSKRLLPMIRKKETLRLRSIRGKSKEKKPVLKKFIQPVGGSGGQTAGESFDAQFESYLINEKFDTFTEVRGRKSAFADQGDEGDDNIIYQMRKVIALRGQFVTKFQDGSKLNVSVPDARKVLTMYSKVRLPKEKQLMIRRMMKNKQNFEAELAGKPNIKLTRKQRLTKHMRREEVELDEALGAWTIKMPPSEGGKTVTKVDTVQVMGFIKSKGGSNRDMQSIKKGKDVTFQGKKGGFYKIIKEEVEFPEGKGKWIQRRKTRLPPHLAKFFDKKGNLNPDAAKRVEKGRTKRGVKIIDKTPKGYGPNEEVDYDESFELFLEWPHGVSTGHPVAAPTSHIAPVSSALVGNDEDPTDKDSKKKDAKKKESTAKVDTLLRLGLVPRKDLVKYRRALKGGEAALKHPELRSKIGDLLQRLLKITTSDKAIYAKLRLKASEKEKVDKQVKEDGDVDVDEADSPLDRRHEREKDRMVVRQARQKAASTVRTVRKKAMESLEKKSDKSGIPVEVLEKVFDREETYEKGFNRVNSFIAFGEARNLDSDLAEDAKMAKVSDANLKSRMKQQRDLLKTRGDSPSTQFMIKRLGKEMKKRKLKEDHGAGELGTDELSNTYKRDTPGQSEGHSLAFDYVMKPRIAPTAKEIAMHESQPNKFTSETVLIFRTNKVGEVKEMRIGKNKVHEYLSRGWQRKSQ